jgi:uncharacterized protein YqeY
MPLKQTIADELKAAMKARNQARLDVLRMARARLQEAEVALRATQGRDYEITDEESTRVLSGYAKQRRDSIDAYRAAGREDLAAKEEAELAIVQEFLPRQLSELEIREIAREAIASTGAASAKDMGQVMKAVMPKVQGAADGKLISRIVNELLSKGKTA